MTDLLELAARVEAATGGDRELDALASAALRIGTDHSWALDYPDWEGRSDGRVHLEKGGPSFSAPAYTASLDAAMTLVPEGWSRDICDADNGDCIARLYHEDPDQEVWARAKTWPLALTAATLRARAAMEVGGE